MNIPIFNKKSNEHYDLLTETGEELRKENSEPWQEYPRPQMKRENYQILNGTWTLDGNSITVPFPPQSILSGYEKTVKDILIYEKIFTLSEDFTKGKILLHFGAVDQIAKVWVNDVLVGEHEGGYLPFSCDITNAVKKGENHLRVEAIDTLSKIYPYGKQKKDRGGMWYTPVSGIWQTVWLEKVPEIYIRNVKLTPDLSGVDIEVNMSSDEAAQKDMLTGSAQSVETYASKAVTAKKEPKERNSCTVFCIQLTLENGQQITKEFSSLKGRLNLDDITLSDGSKYRPILWTPDKPHLYTMTITCGEDKVETYFALRTIHIEDTSKGKRVCLNGKPIFLHGVLDQGYFSDGIYLPAKPVEYERDILRMKELGINMLRKHIKVEPESFYYACDRLGMLVMQDMVNNGPYSFLFDTALPTIGMKKRNDVKGKISGKRKEFFIRHSKETIEHLYNHPSIVAYTIFNEGWGQFNSDEIYDMVKKWDSTRLVDSTSGWFAQKKNDFDSEHIYFKVIPLQVRKRPLFVSECGGYSLSIKGHHYSKNTSYGYGTCENEEDLTNQILYMYENMILPFVADGLCGCVYTQLSDVEDEINGLYTYDRKVCKVNKKRMLDMAGALQENCK